MAERRKRRKRAAPQPVGLTPGARAGGEPPDAMAVLEAKIGTAGGEVLARYRDPLGGHWLALAALPLTAVAPTPFQPYLS